MAKLGRWPRLLGAIQRLNSSHLIYLLGYTLLFFVGIVVVQLGGSVAGGAGSSLIAAGIAGWVLFLVVFRDQEEARRRKVLVELGFVDAFTARSAQIKDEYDARVARARQSIDVMGFGLSQLREDYGTDFDAWAARANVRILLLDPEAPTSGPTYASQRDSEEGNNAGRIAGDVGAFLRSTEVLRQAQPDRFQVRLYSALPSINVFRVDDEIFWGPYLVARQSRNTPTFVVRRGGGLFDTLLEHFDNLWKNPELSHPPAAASQGATKKLGKKQ